MVFLCRLIGSQSLVLALAVAGLGDAQAIKRQSTTSPTGTLQVYQTTPELFAGKSFAPCLTSDCSNPQQVLQPQACLHSWRRPTRSSSPMIRWRLRSQSQTILSIRVSSAYLATRALIIHTPSALGSMNIHFPKAPISPKFMPFCVMERDTRTLPLGLRLCYSGNV